MFAILILWSASASLPEARTVCGRAARTGLCGGRRATGAPTATTAPSDVLAENMKMLKLARKLGFTTQWLAGGITKITLKLKRVS